MTKYDASESDRGRSGVTRGVGDLFPASVILVERFHDVLDGRLSDGPLLNTLRPDGLFPEERGLVDRAVDRRRREFTTARICAREALRLLGHSPVPIPRGPSGAPLWPAGVLGSITHCEGYRAAAVTMAGRITGLGFDAEPNLPLADPAMLPLISLPSERRHLSDLAADSGAHTGVGGYAAPDNAEVHWERLLFSAKESVYKAWNPIAGRRLGFADAEITFSPGDGTFRALPTIQGHGWETGFDGTWQLRDGILLTAVTIVSNVHEGTP
ncbi:4'-phosphopantetheinyl transferase [Streptomyces cinereoruber]|uniref:4'-phosphopantetheinyl transferase family protein n=1 Tax=Streptomyces cinereoruber TaxID=67260 RepID=UPI00363D28E6